MGIFSDINEVQLLGNVTQDPIIKQTTNGTSVATINIATNRNYKKGDVWEKETTFHTIVLWGILAKQVEERVNKGTKVLIRGRINNRSWDDKDVNKKYKTEIVASDIILLSRYTDKQNTNQPTANPTSSSPEEINLNELPF